MSSVPRHVADDDPRHGLERGYAAGCRKPCCREAHRIYSQHKKEERIARGVPDHVHGTRNGYNNYGCHCDKCQIAMVGKGH